MRTSLKLTKTQEDLLYLLRLDGLKREIELHESMQAYENAKEIEKTVIQYVIDNNNYTVGLENDPEFGNLIELERDSFMIDESVFENDFLPKVKDAYMSLYGIDNPLNFVYSHPMHERKMKAEKAYHMIAVDFLKISGRQLEAETIKKAITGYLKPSLVKSLIEITDSFINGSNKVHPC